MEFHLPQADAVGAIWLAIFVPVVAARTPAESNIAILTKAA
jgi:hypothetical protein